MQAIINQEISHSPVGLPMFGQENNEKTEEVKKTTREKYLEYLEEKKKKPSKPVAQDERMGLLVDVRI